MARCFKLFTGLILVLAAAAVMRADETAVPVTEQAPPAPAAEKAALVSDARIAELVKQLDSDDFAEREAAVNALVEIGPAAAKRVAEAAQSESLEASTRAFTVLDKWLAGDQVKQAAAREQLTKLAQGPEENSAVRRAKALLSKQQTAPDQPAATVFGGAFVPGLPLRVGVARVEVRAMAQVAGAGQGRSISVSIADGKKTMNVVEGDFKAEIIEDAKTGIKITTTAKDKDGKEKKTEYAAKNLEELKEKQPEGHKIYEKYAGQMNQLKIKMEAGAVGVGGAFGLPQAAPLSKEQPKAIEEKLKAPREEVQKKIEELKAKAAQQQAEKPAEEKPAEEKPAE